MGIIEFAEMLNGREYRQEITKEEAAIAKEENLVIVFGASDDLMEFRGAIYEEVGCWDGGEAFIDDMGMLLENKCDDSDCPYFKQEKEHAFKITAVWDSEGYSWIYKTDIPHKTFDILEDGEKYCRGIVFKTTDM